MNLSPGQRGAGTPRRRLRGGLLGMLVMLMGLSALPLQGAVALTPQNQPFQNTWQRTDLPVAQGAVTRTWMWGPGAFTSTMEEWYDDAPSGVREVQYFEKSRMEITNPNGDPNSPWYVTNGLIAKEMVSGEMQFGDNAFETVGPAQVNVAGDSDDPTGPTYATFNAMQTMAPFAAGSALTETVDRNGGTTNDPSFAQYGVTAAEYAPETNHRVASVFWSFMNASGLVNQNGANVNDQLFQFPYYATGLPITEAYWSTVRVGGTSKAVLMQVFERRVLTYTPSNAPEWQVEMGNVGQHYYQWRYNTTLPQDPATGGFGDQDGGTPFLMEWPLDLDGNSVATIYNDSPFDLTASFSGPTGTFSFVIPPSPGSIIYADLNDPNACSSADGLEYWDFDMPPGTYTAQFSWSDASFTPSWSYWTLVPNSWHSICWYVTN